VLMAQAVPSASLIPCIETLPAGWFFESSDIRKGEGVFRLGLVRERPRVLEVGLTAGCRPSGTEIPTDENKPGTRLLLDIDSLSPRYTGTRFYLFDGGCVSLRFSFPSEDRRALSTDAAISVGLMSRISLARELATHP
jgi:hypothetical protein